MRQNSLVHHLHRRSSVLLYSKECKNRPHTVPLNLKGHVPNMIDSFFFKKEKKPCFEPDSIFYITFGDMICVGEIWLEKIKSLPVGGSRTISSPPFRKAITCPFIHFTCAVQINIAALVLPGGSRACHLSSRLFSLLFFPVLIASQESQRGLYVRFYLQRSTRQGVGGTKWSLNLRTAPSKLLEGMLQAH